MRIPRLFWLMVMAGILSGLVIGAMGVSAEGPFNNPRYRYVYVDSIRRDGSNASMWPEYRADASKIIWTTSSHHIWSGEYDPATGALEGVFRVNRDGLGEWEQPYEGSFAPSGRYVFFRDVEATNGPISTRLSDGGWVHAWPVVRYDMETGAHPWVLDLRDIDRAEIEAITDYREAYTPSGKDWLQWTSQGGSDDDVLVNFRDVDGKWDVALYNIPTKSFSQLTDTRGENEIDPQFLGSDTSALLYRLTGRVSGQESIVIQRDGVQTVVDTISAPQWLENPRWGRDHNHIYATISEYTGSLGVGGGSGGDLYEYVCVDGVWSEPIDVTGDGWDSSMGRSYPGCATPTGFLFGVGVSTRWISSDETYTYDGVWAAIEMASDLYVDDGYTESACGAHTWGYDAFSSIQDAINAADDGATIHIACGTYNEAIVIDKSLTLLGESSASTIIDGSGATCAVTVGADDVTIDGFGITNPTGKHGITAQDHSRLSITNNALFDIGTSDATTTGTNWGIAIVCADASVDSVEIKRNDVYDIAGGPFKSADGIVVGWSSGDHDVTNLDIETNHIYRITSATEPYAAGGRGAYGILVNHANAASAAGRTVSADITGNHIHELEGLWAHGIGCEGNMPNGLVLANNIHDLVDHKMPSDAVAVMVEDNISAQSLVIEENVFERVALGVQNVCAGPVSALNNYWGAASGPGPVGPGSGVGVSTNVTYSPWFGDSVGSFRVSENLEGELVVAPGMETEQLQAVIDEAVDGTTILLQAGVHPGGICLTNPGVLIRGEPGAIIGPGSPAYTISASDVTIIGVELDGAGANCPAIVVEAGADNCAILDCDIHDWYDGLQVTSSNTSAKLIGNYIHNNGATALRVDETVELGGVVTIEGNLFKANKGSDIVNGNTSTTLPCQYNSFGSYAAPSAMAGVDASNHTFAEIYMDMDMNPATVVTEVLVYEGDTFEVALKIDAKELTGLTFKLNYDQDVLTLNSATWSAPFANYKKDLETTPRDGQEYWAVQLYPGVGVPINGEDVTVLTLNFTATPALGDAGPWEQYFDISNVEAETSAGAPGGVKIYVNNAGYGAASIPQHDITGEADGLVNVWGIAQFTGFVDLQGRASDAGATVEISQTGTLMADATSASSGAWTSANVAPERLATAQTYSIIIDAPMYLPSTVNSIELTDRPLTDLALCKLLGGDATDDDQIDIADISLIGGEYGKTSSFNPNADVNIDARVDILDLVLAAGNYGLSASPW